MDIIIAEGSDTRRKSGTEAVLSDYMLPKLVLYPQWEAVRTGAALVEILDRRLDTLLWDSGMHLVQ
jgi:hypothetical protein